MKQVEVVEVLSVPAGLEVELSDAQAASRGHVLTHVKGKRWRALGRLQFKAGETLGVDPSLLGKGMVRALADVKDPARRKPPAKAAEPAGEDANQTGGREPAPSAVDGMGEGEAIPGRLV